MSTFYLLRYSKTYELKSKKFNHKLRFSLLSIKIATKQKKIDQNLPITSYIDIGLHFWLKSLHVVEKCINKPHPLQHMVIESARQNGKSKYTNIWVER